MCGCAVAPQRKLYELSLRGMPHRGHCRRRSGSLRSMKRAGIGIPRLCGGNRMPRLIEW